jgi:exodeoxyribonuclease-3
LQEIKAKEEQMQDPLFSPKPFYRFVYPAQRPGYSGVAIYSRFAPQAVHYGLGFPLSEEEGRYLQLDFAHVRVASIYLPSGSSGPERQAQKFMFMEAFAPLLTGQLAEDPRPLILCGDWNIAHQNIDLKNWRANQKNSGFLPEERSWLSQVFNEWGYCDAFRLVNQEAEQYTWWSHRGKAYEKNVGWRIDYQIISAAWRERVRSAYIEKHWRFSDHAPLVIDYTDDT